MSRRLRVEEERALIIEQIQYEEDYITVQLRKIDEPLVWRKTDTGIRIQDIRPNQYDEVTEIVKTCFLPNEILCANSELMKDEESLNFYLEKIRRRLKESCSIIAIDENYVFEEDSLHSVDVNNIREKIVGVLILSIIKNADSTRIFSCVEVIEGEAMQKCMKIKAHLNRTVNIFEKMNCECFLCYYELCVIPEYKHKLIDYHLMFSGILVAHSLNIPVIGGVFPDYATQKLARGIGMQVINEVSYCNWRDLDSELIFDDPGAGNYTCALMAGEVPPPPSPPIPIYLNVLANKPRLYKQMEVAKIQKEKEEAKAKELAKLNVKSSRK